MNRTNILQLANYIEQLEPKEYDQSCFVHDCGTPACIAGHAIDLAGQWSYNAAVWDAVEWLGLDNDQGHALFDPIPLSPDDKDPTTQDAAATLRHLAETGEVDWSKGEIEIEPPTVE